MSTTTKPRAPRNAAAIKASQATEAKAAETKAAQAVKVAEAEAEATAKAEAHAEATLSERQNFYVNGYRNAEATHGSSKHAANVAAVAFFRTLPEAEVVKTAKSSQTKKVSARARAAKTIEALCVRVERDAKGNVTKGLDTIGYTVQRLTMLVDAFTNAERTGVVKVEALASGEGDSVDAEKVEALVSALDQAAVVSGKRAAEALASDIRERIEVEAEGGDEGAPLSLAVETAQADVKTLREVKAEQAKATPVTVTPAQKVGDAIAALYDVLEAEAQNLDAGQKSAMLGKINDMLKFLK